jgi:hypothetical protein
LTPIKSRTETAMRATALLIAAACVVTAAGAAQAQQGRPLSVTVEGRSWLDPGKVVATESLSRHVGAANRAGFSPPNGNFSNLYGMDSLPSHIGAGANPFANSFFGPSLR